MTCFQKLIKFRRDRKGVALLIVLASMATLSVFVGEITYTAQINQKLAYDRLDQVKAQALAKSGLKLALLRIRAYTEIKKQIGQATKAAGVSADAANSVVPKAIIEKIWSEPITVPFTGDISSLPSTIKDALGKFRKDSSMEGKLYISIEPQSNKFNLNSVIPQFASQASAASSPAPNGSPAASPAASPSGSPSSTPAAYDVTEARKLLLDQIKTTFQKKMETDEKFRDNYRSYRVEELVDDILGWEDLAYDSPREQVATIPFKRAPFYNISELHYLLSMDDDVYNLLSEQFTTGVASAININMIKEPVLRALVPQMTDQEVKKFFEDRDNTGEKAGTTTAAQETTGDDTSFKSAADFFKYLKQNVQAFGGSDSRVNDLQTALSQRGIQITVEESNFLVHIEATVQQTKRTLEAMVSLGDSSTPPTTGNGTTPAASPAPSPNASPNPNGSANNNGATTEKSNLKITQLRFL